MNKLAPILLFTYKRLETLKETVCSLQQNHLAIESELFIFSDAAKTDYDIPMVSAVREYLNTIKGFKRITVYKADVNKGLANSIIDGVNHVMSLYEKVIVLEDDLKTSPNFLSYMNRSLDQYANVNSVFSISGYSFNLGVDPNTKKLNTYFLNRGWSWGWATWKNRWDKVDWLVGDYADFITDKLSQKKFAKGGSDLNGMLRKQMSGQLDSWAIRWFYCQFRLEGLTLYPIFSKVHNIGFDNDATHTTGSDNRYKPLMDLNNSHQFTFPNEVNINSFYQKRFQRKMGIRARVRSKIESILKQAFNVLSF